MTRSLFAEDDDPDEAATAPRSYPAPADAQVSRRVFSYGGGTQSNAALVLAAKGIIDFRTFLWSNVGDDSEHPKTPAYVREVAQPYAAAHGIELLELRREYVDGRPYKTIYEAEMDESRGYFNIPLRGRDGGPLKRQCTSSWKIEVIGRWLKRHGVTADRPAVVGIGFSTDEILERGKTPAGWVDARSPEQIKDYPLVPLGIDRAECQRIIADAGLPPPGKSSCYFCPFHSAKAWSDLRREEPVLFKQSVELEAMANRKLLARGRGDRPVFLTRYGRPLAEAVEDLERQGSLFDPDGPESCDDGYCWT